ncbi:MAG TPA: hypothetical protein VFG94_06435, partial [Acidimicrobiales bacterium]|nr:hypothetical protein [Acidimicrobiales bacterium]
AWRSMSEEPVPPWSLRTVGASVLVLQVVPLVLNWRYPLERELRRREKACAEPTTPFRWQWVLKALVISIVLALAALVAADAIADIVTG